MRWSNRSRHNVSITGIKELESCRGLGSIVFSKRKGSFIKGDMLGDDDAIGRKVKAAVSFVMS